MNKRVNPLITRFFGRPQPPNTIKSKRRYPIKVDESGRSARSRAFAAFDFGKRPSEIYQELDISFRTACRYFADWKKLPKNSGMVYKILRSQLKNDTGLRETIIDMISKRLHMSKDEVVRRLQTPHGSFRLMTDSYAAPQAKFDRPQERRLVTALRLYDILELAQGIPRTHINDVASELMQVIKAAREKYGPKIPDKSKKADAPTSKDAMPPSPSTDIDRNPHHPRSL